MRARPKLTQVEQVWEKGSSELVSDLLFLPTAVPTIIPAPPLFCGPAGVRLKSAPRSDTQGTSWSGPVSCLQLHFLRLAPSQPSASASPGRPWGISLGGLMHGLRCCHCLGHLSQLGWHTDTHVCGLCFSVHSSVTLQGRISTAFSISGNEAWASIIYTRPHT